MPRAGLFTRNFAATLVNRNRALQGSGSNFATTGNSTSTSTGQANATDNEHNTASHNNSEQSDEVPTISIQADAVADSKPAPTTPSKKAQIDDVESFFDGANGSVPTPHKTPRSNIRRTLRAAGKALNYMHDVSTESSFSFTVPEPVDGSKTGPTENPPQNVLIAKPVAIIPSKIAAHYRKEPRLEVAMSAVEQELTYSEAQALMESANTISHHDSVDDSIPFPPATPTHQIENDIEEMQSEQRPEDDYESDVVDKFMNLSSDHVADNETEVHLSSLIKRQMELSNHHPDNAIGDDALMDRLADEILVQEESRAVMPTAHAVAQAAPAAVAKQMKPRSKPKATSGARITRRPLTYFPGAEYDENGVRRGKRQKLTPLKYWANEKVCYGRANDPSITLPVIVNVIKHPEVDDPTFGSKPSARGPRAAGPAGKLRGHGFGPEVDVEGVVNNFLTGEEEERVLALSYHHIVGDTIKDAAFKIHTVFTEGTYMSSGQLLFPHGAQKPTKNSARHALVFYVIEGSFRVEIHKTSFVIGPGGQFHVPRANHYTITHITTDKKVEGRLFFCHCKDNAESAPQ